MNEIKCPNCGKVFSVDEASYASVVNQVRNKEFMAEVQRRAEELERLQQEQIKGIALSKQAEFDRVLAAKDAEILRLQGQVAQSQSQTQVAV